MTNRVDEPSARLNRQPILDVLARILPAEGMVLEIASGTGQHAGFMAPRLAPLIWQPSDLDSEKFDSIKAWTDEAVSQAGGEVAIRAPIILDARAATWPIESADAIVCINMIHIAPIEACFGLLAGAGRVLPPGGLLYLYGPFMRNGVRTVPSNQRFDDWLRSQDARWGVRNLDMIAAQATDHGLVLDEIVEMPANNLSVIFRKCS